MDKIARVAKAVTAAVVAGATAVVSALPDGVDNDEWGIVAGAVVAAFVATYFVPNKPAS